MNEIDLDPFHSNVLRFTHSYALPPTDSQLPKKRRVANVGQSSHRLAHDVR